MEATTQNQSPILTVAQFSARHPAFSAGSLRSLIFLSKPRRSSAGKIPANGLASALVRIGRRVLIDEDKFIEWARSHGAAKAS